MAHDGQFRFGVPMGAVMVFIAAVALTFALRGGAEAAEPVRSTSLAELFAVNLSPVSGGLLKVIASGLSYLVCTWGAASGWGNPWVWGLVVTAAFVALVASVFVLGRQLGGWGQEEDDDGSPKSLLKRHGFWLVVLASSLYLPSLGVFSLWDPWETHYGEVAREILSRDDWVSLWWAQDGWFWSKPILNFWIQALAMATLGVHYHPDQMLDGIGDHTARPEWVMRTPNFLLTVFGVYVLYKGVAKVVGRRPAFLGGVVLLTVPGFYFFAHQTMTDMPFVAPMMGAMGLLIIGLHTDEDRLARVYELRVGKFSVKYSAWHLLFGAILACVIPQVLYLLSRNLELVLNGDGAHGFRPRFDEFHNGSAGGNCGLPGNVACGTESPSTLPKFIEAHPESLKGGLMRFFLGVEPGLQAVVWSVLTFALFRLNRNERRVRRLCYMGGWFLAAVATMGKGPIGFGLPVLCALAFLAARKRFSELLRVEIVSGLLIILVVALPWFVAMYVRHGSAFTDRLIFHDMFNRAFSHVHDTNEGDDTSFRFYVWQLGYALFPWTGLAALGGVFWLRKPETDDSRQDVAVLLSMWFVLAFAVFSMMGTKFHHYIFPAVPAVAMLAGMALDTFFGKPKGAHERRMIGAAAIGSALATVVIGRDLYNKPPSSDPPGAIRLLHLFTYNYKRAWPDSLDFRTSLLMLTVVASGLLALLSVEKLRRVGTAAFTAFAVGCAFWGLDVYMVKTAPHWGQHEVIEAYYRSRKGPEEMLVAYQMNWKGENFYTGNRIPAFVSSGATFTNWLKQQRQKGVHVMYFVTEHTRVGGLRNEVAGRVFRELTTRELCNKFVLVRAEL